MGELIDCPRVFEGRLVTYEGEVIDVVLDRGDSAWAQLNDDPYSGPVGPLPEHRTALGGNSGIAVSLPRAVANRIRHVGGYNAQGDVVEVVARFRPADPADGGAPTLHAVSGRIVRPGHAIRHPLSIARVIVAVVLSTLTLVLLSATLAAKRTGPAAARRLAHGSVLDAALTVRRWLFTRP